MAESALAIQEPDDGQGRDFEFLGEFVLPHPAIEVLRPGHLLLFEEALDHRTIAVEIDSNYLQALGMKLVIDRFEIGQGFAAGSAPRRPEVHQHHLAPEGLQIHHPASHRHKLHLDDLAQPIEGAQGGAGAFLLLGGSGRHDLLEERARLVRIIIGQPGQGDGAQDLERLGAFGKFFLQ